MLGQFGQLAQLLRNAGQMRQALEQVRERLATVRYGGQAGGGQVEATVDGRGELLRVRIDPQLVSDGDVELIEELVAAAVRDAVQKSREALQQEISQATGGLDLSGLTGMLGPP